MDALEHEAFMREWRSLRHKDGSKIVQAEYDLIFAAIDGTWKPPAASPSTDPAWLAVARLLIGTREIKGPKHNGFISKGWARLGAPWFNDDETPWCGLFVAHCVDAAGLPYSRANFARAKSWVSWGQPCAPTPGAVVVFGRSGGGHVGFLVGQSAENYYVLGGNQSDAVNIMPLAKARALDGGIRWPSNLPVPSVQLPAMSGGTVSVNER